MNIINNKKTKNIKIKEEILKEDENKENLMALVIIINLGGGNESLSERIRIKIIGNTES